jgi:hypothetical protein
MAEVTRTAKRLTDVPKGKRRLKQLKSVAHIIPIIQVLTKSDVLTATNTKITVFRDVTGGPLRWFASFCDVVNILAIYGSSRMSDELEGI